jgi:hypothetical protein
MTGERSAKGKGHGYNVMRGRMADKQSACGEQFDFQWSEK